MRCWQRAERCRARAAQVVSEEVDGKADTLVAAAAVAAVEDAMAAVAVVVGTKASS